MIDRLQALWTMGKMASLRSPWLLLPHSLPEGEESVYARARDACAMQSFYTTTFMLHGTRVVELVRFGVVQRWGCCTTGNQSSTVTSWIVVSGIMTCHGGLMDRLGSLAAQDTTKSCGGSLIPWLTRFRENSSYRGCTAFNVFETLRTPCTALGK